MPQSIPIGTRGEARETVEFKHTLKSHHEMLPLIYSTPDMIRLMETAGFRAMHPFCEADELSVGTHINIEHRAASGIGSAMIAEAVVESFDGRFYILRVTVRDETREVGRGTIGRAIVNVTQFMEKMRAARAAD
jgi:fluoroacetyl-CoA thioesterase